MSEAERHELGITFDVGHQVEHLVNAVMDAPHRPKNRHFSLRRSILPLGGRNGAPLGGRNGAKKASGNQTSDIDLYQLLLERVQGGAKSPRPTLIRTGRSQLMQVNIGGANVRQTVLR